MKYSKVDCNGDKINWMKIKWLRFSKKDQGHILFKYCYDREFKKMRVIAVDEKRIPIVNLRGERFAKKVQRKTATFFGKKEEPFEFV